AHALGRAVAVALLAAPAARGSGLGAAWASGITTAGLVTTLVVGGVIATITVGAWAVPMLAVATVGVVAVAAVARRTLGGVTGDVLGAAEQAAEILVLLLAAAVVTSSAPGFPWWR
ncbi:MAG: adenosylcobinamide-GDP ribazoletransferase, partial [Acidimicrobiales bacterium]